MSGRRTATIGLPNQAVDVLNGDDIDGRSGRLLTVAELQRALAAALRVRPDRCTSMQPSPGITMDDLMERSARAEDTTSSPIEAYSNEQVAIPAEERRWGAAPVPVGPTGERPAPVGLAPGKAPAAPIAGEFGLHASELLALSPRDRIRRADEILDAGWAGSRHVLVASTSGGAGRSTVAAAVACAAVATNISTLLLDATGLDESAVATRSGAAAVSRRPWTWAVDPETTVHLAALRRRAVDGVMPVVALAGDRGATPPADAVAAAVRAADFPLVVVDLPAGGPAARAACDAGGSDALVVVVCRPDFDDLDDTTELLHQLTADNEQRVVLTVTPGRRQVDRSTRRRVAAAAQSTAGLMTVPYLPALVSRRSAVTEQDAVLAAGRVLAAAASSVQPSPCGLVDEGEASR